MTEHDFKRYKMCQEDHSPTECLSPMHQAQAGSWCNQKLYIPTIVPTENVFSNKTFTEVHGPLVPKIENKQKKSFENYLFANTI